MPIVEVTLEEARAHLGLEFQQQHSARVIGWTIPILLALFSIIPSLVRGLS